MHLIEDGMSITAIHKKYGISHCLLLTLWHKYQELGPTSTKKGNNFKVNTDIKKQIVRDIEDNHITLHSASQKYGPSISIIETWLKIARRDGLQTLDIVVDHQV
jgi:transposase